LLHRSFVEKKVGKTLKLGWGRSPKVVMRKENLAGQGEKDKK